MKNLKAIAIACAMTVSCTAFAQFGSAGNSVNGSYAGYNRLGISYDNSHFGYNKDAGGSDNNVNTNGFGIDYIHGFSLTQKAPVFLEVGINANFNFGSKSFDEEKEYITDEYWMSGKETQKTQWINLQVPVNVVYRFNINDDFSIAPYLGLNFKLNLVGKVKWDYEVDTNVPSDLLNMAGISESDLNEEGKWESLFSKDDMGEDGTWNRFQMGWHIGVGFQYKPFYLGVQYGTDFIPAFKYKSAKVNSADFKLSLGYTF